MQAADTMSDFDAICEDVRCMVERDGAVVILAAMVAVLPKLKPEAMPVRRPEYDIAVRLLTKAIADWPKHV